VLRQDTKSQKKERRLRSSYSFDKIHILVNYCAGFICGTETFGAQALKVASFASLLVSARCARACCQYSRNYNKGLARKTAERWASTMASRARVFADVLKSKPQEYWDYEAVQIKWKYALCDREQIAQHFILDRGSLND
jgi:hypothetical protein